MERKLSVHRVVSLKAGPLARYVAPLLTQDAASLARDMYLKAILAALVDDPTRPYSVRVAAGDLRSALLMVDPAELHGTAVAAAVVRRATVLQETVNRHAGIDGVDPLEAPNPRTESTEPVLPENPRLPVVVWIPHLRSPFNVGNIIRTVAAFGGAGVVLGEATPDLNHARLRRASMGALDMVPVIRGGARDAADLLGDATAPVVALETGGVDITRFAFPGRGIMVVGHEELGTPEGILEMCRHAKRVVTIPHGGAKSSLNVGVAAGICLSWWQAQALTG
ncbi:MAG: TrmH family RNA methyltransferase [Alkalispirochaeta sp.]